MGIRRVLNEKKSHSGDRRIGKVGLSIKDKSTDNTTAPNDNSSQLESYNDNALETIIDSAPMSIFLAAVNNDGFVYLDANPLFLERNNVDRSDLKGMKPHDFLSQDEADHLMKEIDTAIEMEKVHVFEAYSGSGHRGEEWTETTVKPILGAEGEITQIVAITKDITQRKKRGSGSGATGAASKNSFKNHHKSP